MRKYTCFRQLTQFKAKFPKDTLVFKRVEGSQIYVDIRETQGCLILLNDFFSFTPYCKLCVRLT